MANTPGVIYGDLFSTVRLHKHVDNMKWFILILNLSNSTPVYLLILIQLSNKLHTKILDIVDIPISIHLKFLYYKSLCILLENSKRTMTSS